MRTSRTIGFAVDDSDRPRLDHLTTVFGGGNRSEFLRQAMDVMDRYEAALKLVQVQAYGSTRLALVRMEVTDIPELVERALADPNPDAVAQAKLILAGIHTDGHPVVRTGEPGSAAAVFAEMVKDG